MGATSSSSSRLQPISPESEGTSVEPQWSLPPACQDDIWLKMDLSMLVGTGAGLAGNAVYGGRDFGHTSCEQRGDCTVDDRSLRSPHLGPNYGGGSDEEDDWLAASLCLSIASLERKEMESLVARVKKKMFRNLSHLCSQEDVFCRAVTRRMRILQCVHAAMSRQRRAELESYRGDDIVVPGEKKGTGPAVSAPCGDDVLGLQLFFSLLDFVRDPECGQEQLADFLQQISPVLTNLPPLSLAEGSSSLLCSKQESPQALVPGSKGVVSSLRGFLARIALSGNADDVFPHAESEHDFGTGRETDKSDSEQTNVALSAMVGLVAARGRASDLLVLIKVLLSIPHRKPDMVEVSQDEDEANGLPEAIGLREGHVVAECSAKRQAACYYADNVWDISVAYTKHKIVSTSFSKPKIVSIALTQPDTTSLPFALPSCPCRYQASNIKGKGANFSAGASGGR